MTNRIPSMLLGLLLVAGTQAAHAQQREITGTVVSTEAGQPLQGARVVVANTTRGTNTDPQGNFRLPVPAGDVRLRVSRLGYVTRELAVPAGQNSLRVALSEDVLNLEGLVVTGQATSVARRNLANAVATVSAQELQRTPAPTIDKALQGKIAGANISTNSGAPGGGVQVNLRGVTTINGNTEPLYVVDGVIVSNASIASGANAITGASRGSNASNQDAPVNRIADLNPNDIESVEVLKGASASAIYGSKASNGVIIIRTKSGRAGPPRVTISQRFGQYRQSNQLGSRSFTLSEAQATFPGIDVTPYFNADGTPRQEFDQEKLLAGREDLSTQTDFSVRGGSETTQYYLSGSVQDDEGIIANTGFEKEALRLSLKQQVGAWLNVGLNTSLLHTRANRGLTNNDNTNTSFYMALSATPNFVDLRSRDGFFPNNPFTFSNPLQTAAMLVNDEDVYRGIAALDLRADLFKNSTQTLQAVAVGGADFFQQRNKLFAPRDLEFEQEFQTFGTAIQGNSDNLNLNGNANLIHVFTPGGGAFSATTSAGVQYEERELNINRSVGRNLVAGQDNVSAAATVSVFGDRLRQRDFGVYFQEELLALNDRLLLTGAVRADRSSNNGDPDQFFYYPKAAASYQFGKLGGHVDELKLRAAYGQSGNLPLYGYKFTPLDATNNIGGLPGLVLLGTAGDPDIRPERQRELEGGLDVTLLGGNAQLELTAWRRVITDFLLQRTLAPSTGYALQRFNGGELHSRGFEAALRATPLRTRGFSWYSTTTFATNDATIENLPVPSFRTGGFGTSLGAFQIEEGKSPTQIIGYHTEAGKREVRVLGDANPDFRMGFVNEFTAGRFSLSSLLDWQKGGDIINLTRLLYDAYGVSQDFTLPSGVTEPRSVGVCNPNCSGLERISGFGAFTQQYIEDGGYLKLREVSLTYDIPTGTFNRFMSGLKDAQISLSGRNLVTWTDYSGLDPEVSNFGNQAIARNIDVSPFPPSRSFWLTVNLGF